MFLSRIHAVQVKDVTSSSMQRETLEKALDFLRCRRILEASVMFGKEIAVDNRLSDCQQILEDCSAPRSVEQSRSGLRLSCAGCDGWWWQITVTGETRWLRRSNRLKQTHKSLMATLLTCIWFGWPCAASVGQPVAEWHPLLCCSKTWRATAFFNETVEHLKVW